MRSEHDVAQWEQRMIRLERFFDKNVQNGAGNCAFPLNFYQRRLIDDGAACGVDQISAFFHQAQALLVQKILALLRKFQVDRNDIGVFQDLFQPHIGRL